jgi:hypothetical protein
LRARTSPFAPGKDLTKSLMLITIYPSFSWESCSCHMSVIHHNTSTITNTIPPVPLYRITLCIRPPPQARNQVATQQQHRR